MREEPFISVIVATCFRERLLLECLGSVLEQSHSDFEVLVVDQAPEPVLEFTLQKQFNAGSRLRYLHLPSAGAARARNHGMAQAAASVVAFIDDDAVAEPHWLASLAAALADPPLPALVAGRILPAWTGTRPSWYPKEREFLLGLYDIGGERRPLPDADLPIAANMAGWRQIILDHGGFEESLGPNYFRKRKMITGEETILARRIKASGYPILYEPAAVVKHHVSARKQSRAYFLKRSFWEGVTAARQMQLLGKTGAGLWLHCRLRGREICLALARFLLPRYRNWYRDSTPAIRMRALGRIADSLGALYALIISHAGNR